jgi:hypothetical protein
MKQQRVHNEWFQCSTTEGKCYCGSTKKSRRQAWQDVNVWIWGEYSVGRWRRIQTVCEACFHIQVLPKLIAHANGCGCTFELQARSGHGPLPVWLALPDTFHTCSVVQPAPDLQLQLWS